MKIKNKFDSLSRWGSAHNFLYIGKLAEYYPLIFGGLLVLHGTPPMGLDAVLSL